MLGNNLFLYVIYNISSDKLLTWKIIIMTKRNSILSLIAGTNHKSNRLGAVAIDMHGNLR